VIAVGCSSDTSPSANSLLVDSQQPSELDATEEETLQAAASSTTTSPTSSTTSTNEAAPAQTDNVALLVDLGFDPARFDVDGAEFPSRPEYSGAEAAILGILVNDRGCIGLQGGRDPISFTPIVFGNTDEHGLPVLANSGSAVTAFGQELELGTYVLLGGGGGSKAGRWTEVEFPAACVRERVWWADSARVLDIQEFIDAVGE
jgi:hypothetical protein